MWPVANYVRTCKDYMFGTSAERPALVYSEKMCVGGHGTWDAGGEWGAGGDGGRGEGNVDGEGARVGPLARGCCERGTGLPLVGLDNFCELVITKPN